MRSHASPFMTAGMCAVGGLLVTFLSAGSCTDTDIGAPCNLVGNNKGTEECVDADPQDQPECFNEITLEQLASGQDKDFVSFGAAECDNLTCVRSRGDALPETAEDPNGYCSGECINDQDCQTEEGSYSCRALVLDDEFLNALRESLSPEEYERYFGRIQNAKFCAKPE